MLGLIKVGRKENPENNIFLNFQDERSAFSESPGRETPGAKSWAQSELKNHIFGQIENVDVFFDNYQHVFIIN